ncbi:MAG: ParB/RepB/Spo0J family partition protein [Phycisphaerales bacterium]
MSVSIRDIALDRLVPHPDNANHMSRANFAKLVCNIERTGRYEPLVVRPCPNRRGCFQIINGHHRCEALRKLGRTTAQVVVWKVDDEQTDILLATLNRLGGRDTLDKKLTLLRRLCTRIPIRKLARLLPQTLGQIERLVSAGWRAAPVRIRANAFAIPVVFFVTDEQQRKIEDAISTVAPSCEGQTRAAKRAAALTRMAAKCLAPDRDCGCETPGTK